MTFLGNTKVRIYNKGGYKEILPNTEIDIKF